METLVYTPTETSKLLRISPHDVYQKLERGEIPAYRDGQSWKIPKSTLKKYVEERALEEAKDRMHLQKEVYEDDLGM